MEYTAEELEFLNRSRSGYGLKPIDKFGVEVVPQISTNPKAPPAAPPPVSQAEVVTEKIAPVAEAVEALPIPALEGQVQELQQFGQSVSEKEIKARRKLEEAFRKLVAKKAKELAQTTENFDATMVDGIMGQAANDAMNDIDGLDNIVGGFTLEGYSKDDIPTLMPKMLMNAFGISQEPSSPVDLPPVAGDGEPTLKTALTPQTRVGPTAAEWEKTQGRIGIITPEQWNEKNNIDMSDMSAVEDRRSAQQYTAFYEAFNIHRDAYPTQDLEEAITEVTEYISDMYKILAGQGSEDDYREDIPEGQRGETAFTQPWFKQIKTGKVPNLNNIQETFLRSITEGVRGQALAEEAQQKADVAEAGKTVIMRRSTDTDAIPMTEERYQLLKDSMPYEARTAYEAGGTYEEVTEPVEGASDRPQDFELAEGTWEYESFIKNNNLDDHWSLDFWEDKDKYADGYVWNKEYPSGAIVEGPTKYFLRILMAPVTVSGRLLTTAGTTLGGGRTGDDWVTQAELRAQEADSPLYRDHPFLRNIAEFRGIGDDLEDIANYTPDLEEWSSWAFGAGLLTDILFTPYDPGITAAFKGIKAGKAAAATSKILGAPARITAKSFGKEFIIAASKGYYDQTILSLIKSSPRMADPIALAGTRAGNWIADEAAFVRAYNRIKAQADPMSGFDLYREQNMFKQALEESSKATGGGKSMFRDSAGVWGYEKTIENLGSISRKAVQEAAPLQASKYYNYIDDLEKFATGKLTTLPHRVETQGLLDALRIVDPDYVKSIKGLSLEDAIKTIYNTDKFEKFIRPLHRAMGSHVAIGVIEGSKALKGGVSNLTMVTPKLFLEPQQAGILAKSLKEEDLVKKMVDLAKLADKTGRIKTGLYPFFQRIKGNRGKASFRPRTGSYIEITMKEMKEIRKIVSELKKGGFLNSDEASRIMAGLNPQGWSKLHGKEAQISNIAEYFDLTKRFLSMDNTKVITNALIERHAFAKGLGIKTQALEGATTATKRQLMLSIENRHLRGNWIARKWNNWFGKAKGWDKGDMDGAPLSAIIRASEYRGQLSNLSQLTKKELDDILMNPDVQKFYFTEEFLAQGKPTRNDAIVAGMLGPIAARSATTMHRTLDVMMNIVIYGEDTVSPMAMFMKGSLRRQKLADELSTEGSDALKLLMYGDDGLNGYINKFKNMQGHREYVDVMEEFYKEFTELLTKPSSFKDASFTRKAVPLDELTDITAGTYFVNKANRLAEEALDDIVTGWDSLGNVVNNQKLAKTMKDMFDSAGDEINKILRNTYTDELAEVREILERLEGPSFDLRPGSTDMAWLIGKVENFPHWDEFVPGGLGRLDYPVGHPMHMKIDEYSNYSRGLERLQTKSKDVMKDYLKFLEGKSIRSRGWTSLLAPSTGDEMAGLMIKAITNRVKEIVKHRAAGQAISPTGVAATIEDWTVVIENILGVQPRYAKPIIEALSDPNVMDEGMVQLRQLLVKAKEDIDQVAIEIVKANKLNFSNGEEVISAINWIVEDLNRLGKTITETVEGQADLLANSGKVTEEMHSAMTKMADDDFINMLSAKIMGETTETYLKEVKNTNEMVQNIRKALSNLYDVKKSKARELVNFLDGSLRFATATRYTLILAARWAFHSINMATAPTIVYGTMGGRAAASSIWNLKEAHKVWQVGRSWMKNKVSATESMIAVTDKFGRSYTYREVWDMAIGSGALRSETAIIINSAQFEHILKDTRFTPEYRGHVTKFWNGLKGQTPSVTGGVLGAIAGGLSPVSGAYLGTVAGGVVAKQLPTKLARRTSDNTAANFLMNLTEWEDQYFRLTQVISGLKKGDDPFIAVSRGRGALYDYGSLTKAEQWASSRLLMFYAFARLNIVNTISLLLYNPKRLANLYQMRRMAEITGGPDTSGVGNFYAHHFLLSRPMLSYMEGSDKTSHYESLPPVPALDGLSVLAQIMMAPNLTAMLAPLTDLANPDIKLLRGTPSRLEWKKDYVDPADMEQLYDAGLYSYFWDTVVKEEPHRKQAVAGDQTYQGSTWWLSPAGMERYYYWKNHLAPFLTFPSVMGGDTKVLGNMVIPSGIEGKRYGRPEESSAKKMARGSGFITEIGTLPQSAQRESVVREITKRLEQLEEGN